MKIWIIYIYISTVCLLFFIYNIYLRKKIKRDSLFEETFKKSKQKFYMKNKNKILTNIENIEIEEILNKIAENNLTYKDYKIEVIENGFFLEKEDRIFEELESAQDKLEEEHEKLLKEKDANYYLQKESAMKLGFILQDIYDLKTEVLKKEDIKYLIKLENIESKLEFFVNFMYGKTNVVFHKYRLYYPENIAKIFETQFKGKIEFKIEQSLDNKERIYFEEEKFYHFFKAIIYSILKNENEKLEIEMKRENKLLLFKISREKGKKDGKTSNDEEFFDISGIKEEGWNINVSEEGEYLVKIPINNDIPDWAKEEKRIEIFSDLKNIKTVDRNIIYDMYSRGFTEKDGSDMKLVLDELLTNAVEHGNKYDISKKVKVKYRFNTDKGIQIEISDEGDGFLMEKIKSPDSSSERGRGIFIVRKLVEEIDYRNNGRTVLVYKKRSIKNDSE